MTAFREKIANLIERILTHRLDLDWEALIHDMKEMVPGKHAASNKSNATIPIASRLKSSKKDLCRERRRYLKWLCNLFDRS